MYNATIYGKNGGVSVAEVVDGKILRSNAIQCTGLEGTEAFDTYFRKVKEIERVEIDDCAGYKRMVCGMGVPVSYKRGINGGHNA